MTLTSTQTRTPTRRTSTGRPRRAAPDRPRSAARGTYRPVTRVARTRSGARPSSHPPRMPFVFLIVGLLGGGLISLLLLNTVLAQDAFAAHALRQRTTVLEQREQALRQEVARAEAPDALAEKARALGMVPAKGNAFVDLERGKVVGNAEDDR